MYKRQAGDYVEEWDVDGLFVALDDIFPEGFDTSGLDLTQMNREEVVERLGDEAVRVYDEREEEIGAELMRALERYLLLQIIDQRWREHLYDMDYLREGIHLRGFAQIEPIVAYKNEAFDLFTDLMGTIWADFARMIFHVEIENDDPGANGNGNGAIGPPPTNPTRSSTRSGTVSYSGGAGTPQPSALAAAAAGGGAGLIGPDGYAAEGGAELAEAMPVVEQRRVADEDQVGRNDPCWCGSGKKFKKCHGT